MSYPSKDKFEWNLSRRLIHYNYKHYPMHRTQEIDKDNPNYKYKNPDGYFNLRIMGSLFRSPLGDIWDEFVTMQGYDLPAKVEMKMMNCLEAYGLPQGYTKCEDLIQDYFELYAQGKANKRIDLMREERRRQFEAGERKIKYAVPPKLGSFEEI